MHCGLLRCLQAWLQNSHRTPEIALCTVSRVQFFQVFEWFRHVFKSFYIHYKNTVLREQRLLLNDGALH